MGEGNQISGVENGFWYHDYIVWATSVMLNALLENDAKLANHALSLIIDAVFDSLTEEVIHE